MKDYYFIRDDRVDHVYLTWKENGIFYSDECFGPIAVESDGRKVIKSKPVVLPTEKELNGWILYANELPKTDDIYTCSETVLTYDIERNSLYESNWYPISLNWIDAESMAPYNEHRPSHWMRIPSPKDL